MSKRMKQALSLIEPNKSYNIDEALEMLFKMPKAKFDETVEIHVKLGVDGKKAEEQVRGTMVLPNGSGKSKKVLVIATGEKAEIAEKAGADIVGSDDIITKIANDNFLDFDVLIATPDMMPKLGRVARILGPKGLMPNPKSGTITTDVEKAINDVKAGKIEYRLDKNNIIHTIIGKMSFDKEKLKENYVALIDTIVKAKPAASKGTYILSINICSSMSAGIKINYVK